MIRLLGVPFDLCGKKHGSRLGPEAMRLAGEASDPNMIGPWSLVEQLERASNQEVIDEGDVLVTRHSFPQEGLKEFHAAVPVYRQLHETVKGWVSGGHLPIVMGGDHSISIGSLSGALAATQGDLAVLWIDAHADLNTPGSSPSGNLHGMPVSLLLGLEESGSDVRARQWKVLQEEMVPKYRLAKERIAWLGLRDLDEAEKARIVDFKGCLARTMQDIDRMHLPTLVEQFHSWMIRSKAKNLWISFDVDSLDPTLAPGTGTMVRGGLTYREGHFLAELLAEKLWDPKAPYRLAGLDVVEVNPIVDSHNETAKVAVEWLCSLFGKTIL